MKIRLPFKKSLVGLFHQTTLEAKEVIFAKKPLYVVELNRDYGNKAEKFEYFYSNFEELEKNIFLHAEAAEEDW